MKTKFFTLVLTMALFGVYAFAQNCATSTPPMVGNVCTFNTNGNFTVPPGYSVTVSVQVWGGGGGGGDDMTGDIKSGPGGGGGGYSTGTFTVSGVIPVTVGAGGVPENTIANGHNGGASSFGALVSAGGGLGPTTSGNGGTGALGGAGNVINGGAGGDSTNGKSGGGGGGSGPGATAGDPGGTAGPNGEVGDGGKATGIEDSGGDSGIKNMKGNNGTVPGGGGGGRGNIASLPLPISIFSGFGAAGRVIVTVTAVFPVELISFSGKATPGAIQLNWETSTELNNEKFIIERSTDGRTFQMIGEERGQGTTQQIQSYQFTDQAPVAGLNYYRLKQMDYDGQFAYSPVTAITFVRKGAISVYPTATNGMVNIATEDEGSSQVKVFHINGSLMKQQTFDSNTLPLDLSSLPNGTYLIVVETSTQTHQERIFKF